MLDDDHAVALGAPDALAGGLGDAIEHRRLVGGEAQRHPVPRRLDLADRVEPGRRERRVVGRVVLGNLRVGGQDIDPIRREVRGDRRQGAADHGAGAGHRAGPIERPGHGLAHRPPRRVARATAHQRPGSHEDERPCLADGEEPRHPATRAAVLGPCPRLEDVAAGDVDGTRVPIRERRALELGDGHGGRRHPSPPASPP